MYGFSSTGVTIYCYFGLKFIDSTCCEVIFKQRYNDNDIMTTNKLPAGADPGFQVRGGGGGGGALKKIAPSRGRRENFWGISCEKSRFYAKKSYFSNFRGGRTKFLGYFM